MPSSQLREVQPQLLAAIEAIYAAAPEPSLWPSALTAIAKVFDDMGAILLWQRDDGAMGTIVSPGLEEAQRDFVENGWFRQDLVSIRALQRGYTSTSDTVTDHHVATQEEIDTHPYYVNFRAKHGLKWCAATVIAPDPHVFAGLSVQRSTARSEYSEAELRLVGLIGQHVERALRLSIQLLNNASAKTGLGEALSRLGMAVFALDSFKRVTYSNTGTSKLKGTPINISGDRFYVSKCAARDDIESAIERAVEGKIEPELKPMLVYRTGEQRPLAVYVIPIRMPSSAHEIFLEARALVLVIETKPGAPPEPAVVRDLLGLTLGEAKVASLIGIGLSPREAGNKLGITEETARSALKQVFAKVGISRQSELAALLSRSTLR